VILDTDVLITFGSPRYGEPVRRRIEQASGPLHTTAVNWAELVYGIRRRRTEQRRELFEGFLETTLPELEIIPFDQEDAEVMARVRLDLERRGQRLDTSDLMIASIALRHDMTLVTGNTRHFARVPGLKLENWLGE
jgi:tRNA(fMet)-specific endonuclease VapC